MNSEQRRLIKNNFDVLLRRKKLIIVCLLLGIAAGLAYYLQLPKIYQSTALIRYQRQTVNPTVMSPDDNRTHTKDVISTISQQITSRSSLESLIQEFDLYADMRQNPDMPMEKIVEMMRDHKIETRLLEGGDVFEVSFQGLDQQKVMNVTNALAQRFIDENLRFRQAQASQTSTYIRDELEIAKEALDEKEQVMRDYKLKYYNEMPEQLPNNTNRLNGLQEQIQNLQSSQLELERTKLLIQEQIATRMETLNQLEASNAVAPDSATGGLNTADQIRLRIKNLQPRYTENHPEIRRLKKLLKKVEGEQQDASGTAKQTDPQLLELRQQLKDISLNISQLQNEREDLNKEIQKYHQWINAAPVREAEWAKLTRDYEQLNEYYQRLVSQSLQADSAISLEEQLKGSQFKIVDSAHLPEKPLKPDFKKIFLLAAIVGLGIGAGLSYGAETLSTAYKDPVDLEKEIEIPVVCALPKILTREERRKKVAANVATASLLVLLCAAVIGAVFYYWNKGMIIV